MKRIMGRKTAKTPLARLLQQALHRLRTGEAADALPSSSNTYTRREFLERTTKATAGIAIGSTLLGQLAGCKEEGTADYGIAIVGAGITGLNAARVLRDAGVTCKIYEGSNRTGGRMLSGANLMGEGLVAELGGEFIDSIHTDILGLVERYGLELLDTQADSEKTLDKERYFFGGKHRSLTEVIAEVNAFAPQFEADVASLPDDLSFRTAAQFEVFDKMSLEDYVAKLNCADWMKDFLRTAFVSEYGLEPTEQSCINMLWLLSADTTGGTFSVFGESDERYKVKGGNEQIPKRLEAELLQPVQLGYRLTAVAKKGTDYVLSFDVSGKKQEVLAKYVVLTLPFSMLREVDLSQLPLSSQQKKAVNELGYGTNTKLLMGFKNRIWRVRGATGMVYTDLPVQLGWDNSQLQGGNTGTGGFTVFQGGAEGVKLIEASALEKAQEFLPMLEAIYPGATAEFDASKVERMYWVNYLWSKGSYACYKVGQVGAFGGAEGETVEGRVFFAGEHCSSDFQGYMNGGAETGRLAAEGILAAVR